MSAVGAKSAVTDYTADFTDFTEPFQTPRVCDSFGNKLLVALPMLKDLEINIL